MDDTPPIGFLVVVGLLLYIILDAGVRVVQDVYAYLHTEYGLTWGMVIFIAVVSVAAGLFLWWDNPTYRRRK